MLKKRLQRIIRVYTCQIVKMPHCWKSHALAQLFICLTDLKAFERRLTEVIDKLQPAARLWRSKFQASIRIVTILMCGSRRGDGVGTPPPWKITKI